MNETIFILFHGIMYLNESSCSVNDTPYELLVHFSHRCLV